MTIEDHVNRLNEKSDILAMTFYPNNGIVSTNDMYIPISKGYNTRRAYYKRSSQLIDYQSYLFNYITENYSDKIVDFLNVIKDNKNLGFKVYVYIGMPDMYYKQKSKSNDLRPYDLSNYLKSTEDIIATRLGIDDKYNMELFPIKYKSNEESWRTTVVMIPIDYSMYNEEYILGEIGEIWT